MLLFILKLKDYLESKKEIIVDDNEMMSLQYCCSFILQQTLVYHLDLFRGRLV